MKRISITTIFTGLAKAPLRSALANPVNIGVRKNRTPNMRIIYFLLASLIANYAYAEEAYFYQYPAASISFNHNNVSIDKNSEKATPLSVVFVAGARPFAISVLFREEEGSYTLEEFIQNEKNEQRKGGYEKEVTISKVSLNNIPAYEIVRKSTYMNIRWFLFRSIKNNKLYSFWLAESSRLKKENTQAIEAYQIMKSTLALSK